MMDKFSKALWYNPSNVSAGLEESQYNLDDPKVFECSLMEFVRIDGQDYNRMFASREELTDYDKPTDTSYEVADEFFRVLIEDIKTQQPEITNNYVYPWDDYEEDEWNRIIDQRFHDELVMEYEIDNHTRVYTLAAPYLKYDTYNLDDLAYNYSLLENVPYYKEFNSMLEHFLEDYGKLQTIIPNALKEASTKDNYKTSTEAIFAMCADGIMYTTVYSKNLLNKGMYKLEDVIECMKTGEVVFQTPPDAIIPHHEIIDKKWYLRFTVDNPSIERKDLADIECETGLDMTDRAEQRKIILEGEGFRKAALGLATAAGLLGGYNNLTTPPYTTPTGIEIKQQEKRPLILVRKKPNIPQTNIVSAEAFPTRYLVKFKDANGRVVNSRGFGKLASRNNNPGNLVVNNLESAKRIGAIGFSKNETGNRYAIFATPEAGEYALIAWWEKNSDKATVREMLGRFAPREENKLEEYANFLAGKGVPMDLLVAELTNDEFNKLIEGIKVYEGYYRYPAKDLDKYNT